jgi:hypothetical protein
MSDTSAQKLSMIAEYRLLILIAVAVLQQRQFSRGSG